VEHYHSQCIVEEDSKDTVRYLDGRLCMVQMRSIRQGVWRFEVDSVVEL
jgi:hypothetical protein